MVINHRFTKRIAVLLTLLLLLTPFTALTAGANSPGNASEITTLKESTKSAASSKIDNKVKKEFEKEEYVDVLIELSEQVDTSKVAAEAKQQAGPETTAYNQKMAARYAVVDALRTTAETTQAPLLSTLEQALDQGDVKEYESFYIMNVISVTATKEVVEKLSFFPEVERITENEMIELVLPEKTDEPPLSVTDDNIEWNIDRVQAPEAWEAFGATGQGIVVGVIDTGVQWDHEALKENFRGYNPEDPDNPDPSGNWLDRIGSSSLPVDTLEHGTHVTGTVMGQGPDGTNIIGVAPDAQWIAARAFSALGGSQADLLASGEFMLAPNGDPNLAPDIVQNSWGGSPGISEWFRPMVQAWRDSGILPVFSAGNSGPGAQTVTPPSNYPESYAVAATDSNDAVASFSSRGPANYDGDQKPNISAPGVNIRSAVPGNGYEGGWNGTSMASPHIAGVASLLLSIDASLTIDELEEIMDETAIPLTDSQYTSVPNDGYGVGLINAYDAVASIADGLGRISGSVLTEGTDDTPPEIEHTPFDFAFAGLDLLVEAKITDDIAVTRAEILVSHEDHNYDVLIPMERKSGDHLEGSYEGYIPYMFVQEPGFEYQVIARDFGGNTAATDRYSVTIEFGVVPDEYQQDFENFPVGWMMEGDWEWGEPSGASPNPVAGSRLIGTNLDGSYSHNADDMLLLPPLDLRDTDEASVRLSHWFDYENGWDFGVAAVSGDYGENWEIVHEVTSRDQQWRDLFIDLNDYAGSSDPVFVAFLHVTDHSVAYNGWYVDDVNLVGADTDPPGAPENLEALSSSIGITLNWEAPGDMDVAGYNVYRSTDGGDNYELLGSTSNTRFTDSDTEGGQEYFYTVTAYDFSNNESDRSNEASAVAPSVEVVYHSNFGEDDGGFTTGGSNNSWAWGDPVSGPGESLTGGNLWGTNLTGNYNNNEDSWIMSPEIDLSGQTSAELSFSYWQDIENNWDYGYVQASSDGGDSWDTLATYTGRAQAWGHDEISLSDYTDETIQLRFHFDTDGSVTYPGWYIDEVLVTRTTDNVDYISEPKQTEKSDMEVKDEKPASPVIDYKIQKDSSAYNFEKVSNSSQLMLSESGLPVSGTVTVLETNRTARTNPVDGTYDLRHAANEDGGSWTVRAEAYGYYPQEAEVTVEEDTTTVQNFMMEPLPSGTVEGAIVDQRTGEPVADAAIRVLEDPRVSEVTSDETGAFDLTLFEGEYTLRISADGYNLEEVPVEISGGEVTELTVELRPFIGYEDEIAYDTGVAENALVLNAAGNGLGVKFTPDDMAQLRGVNMYIWGTDFPSPGGNEINIVVYDTDANGNPDSRVIGPVPVEVERGGWNYIDLSEFGFVTDRDFFITTLQDQIGDLSPAVGTDEEHPNAERSYLYIQGAFQPHFDNGNFMIRANVAYSLEAPVIETPADQTYTAEETIEVTGSVTAESEVTVYNNGEPAAVVESEDRRFSAEIDLAEGDNEIYVTAEIPDGVSDPSGTVTVIRDTVLPEISIDSPADGSITNREVATVAGTASDENLASVLINGSEAAFDEDGSFSERVLLDEGENTILVEAADLAGNTTTEELTIFVDTTAPAIENVEPAEDMAVKPGETVTVSFESDKEGGEASFTVSIPGANQPASAHSNSMEETEPGVYTGTWTAPDAYFEGAVVTISITDTAGNTSSANADGKITVLAPVTAESLYQLIDSLYEEGKISRQAANQLAGTLENAEQHYNNGRVRQALSQLERFISLIDSNHLRDASEETKELLRSNAEQLMENWQD
ncbi:S8 family serine peptidase [Evansella clarkii]|uniref:S8 family serine peptidase n=1 Tax=Evansella clarkii TaxID=79879 RepID=UPI0009969439|nr:S8 family serine peptidase [Evansella clarkii]